MIAINVYIMQREKGIPQPGLQKTRDLDGSGVIAEDSLFCQDGTNTFSSTPSSNNKGNH